MRRCIVFLTALLTLTATGGLSAAAASPPSNDHFERAKRITGGYSQIVDTRRATTDPDDDAALAACGGFLANGTHSVWYSYTPTTRRTVGLFFVSESTYPLNVVIFRGTPSEPSDVGCIRLEAGEANGPYLDDSLDSPIGRPIYIWVGDATDSATATGGTARIALQEIGRPSLDLRWKKIDVNREGLITRTAGWFRCKNPNPLYAPYVTLEGTLTQTTSSGMATASFGTVVSGPCDGKKHAMEGLPSYFGQTGLFALGHPRRNQLTWSGNFCPTICASDAGEQQGFVLSRSDADS